MRACQRCPAPDTLLNCKQYKAAMQRQTSAQPGTLVVQLSMASLVHSPEDSSAATALTKPSMARRPLVISGAAPLKAITSTREGAAAATATGELLAAGGVMVPDLTAAFHCGQDASIWQPQLVVVVRSGEGLPEPYGQKRTSLSFRAWPAKKMVGSAVLVLVLAPLLSAARRTRLRR